MAISNFFKKQYSDYFRFFEKNPKNKNILFFNSEKFPYTEHSYDIFLENLLNYFNVFSIDYRQFQNFNEYIRNFFDNNNIFIDYVLLETNPHGTQVQTLEFLKSKFNCKIGIYWADNHNGVGKLENYFLQFKNLLDIIFIGNKDDEQEKLLKELKIKKYFIGQMVDIETFKPLENIEKKYDFLFAGNFYSDQFYSEKRNRIVKILKEYFGERFKVVGHSWTTIGIKDSAQIRNLNLLNLEFQKSKFLLGIDNMNDVPGYTSRRAYLCMSSGVPYISNYFPKVYEVFNQDSLYVSNLEEDPVSYCKNLLNVDYTSSLKIGLNGRKEILEKYTLKHFCDILYLGFTKND